MRERRIQHDVAIDHPVAGQALVSQLRLQLHRGVHQHPGNDLTLDGRGVGPDDADSRLIGLDAAHRSVMHFQHEDPIGPQSSGGPRRRRVDFLAGHEHRQEVDRCGSAQVGARRRSERRMMHHGAVTGSNLDGLDQPVALQAWIDHEGADNRARLRPVR